MKINFKKLFFPAVCLITGLLQIIMLCANYMEFYLSYGKDSVDYGFSGFDMFDLAEQNYTDGLPVLDEFRGTDHRGLGFVYVDGACYQACELFPDGSIGHEGYTGQSFFLNRELGLYVIILSNATRCTVKKYGKARYEEVCDLRAELHREIGRDLGLIKE